jgi:3-oxoacyl-(acyl-carrier-protein) synthase/SAM-dependent methyltransferase/NADP-dependent 3-hydroxy acid dehydrogenase YdfG/acyl carrier protein
MTARQTPMAVIGMACRFPGADTPAAFADMLEARQSAVRDIPPDRWDVAAIYDATPGTPGRSYARHAGLLDTVDRFDAAAFGIAPKEAVGMDPQQRLLLEIASEAFADAGLPRHRLTGARVGVYVGISTLDYLRLQPPGVAGVDAYSGSGNAMSIAANRISYCFGLEGPSLAVDTACSSSLVAVDLAVQALARGDIDTALVAGVNLILAPELMVAFCAARMLAPDGRCKTFDAAADGYVRGEGAGAIVLRRAEDATADADRIYARILGTAVNQDGRSNGLTAPNGPRQTAVVRTALERAGAVPQDLAYVEAHGTGTPLGDPIEMLALADVLGTHGVENGGKRCTVGSVKTNIGHLEAAAGIAGVIKTAMALHRGIIPPSLNFQAPNPDIPLAQMPIDLALTPTDWPSDQGAVAGVSSFGFGGTNAHVILAPSMPITSKATPAKRAKSKSAKSLPKIPQTPWPLLITGSTVRHVRARAAEFAGMLQTDPDCLPALSVTLMTRITLGDFRAAVVASGPADAIATLLTISRADDDSATDRDGAALSTAAAPMILARLRKRARKVTVLCPTSAQACLNWPADWLRPADFVAALGCTAEPDPSASGAATLIGALLEHAVRGRDMPWHEVLPAMVPLRLAPEPWDRRLTWFDPARAPSVRGAAARWLAGLPGVEITGSRVDITGALPADLTPHQGLVPFPLGLALMTASALRSAGPVQLSQIRILRPLHHADLIELTAKTTGSAVTVSTPDGAVWMDADITALPDWPAQDTSAAQAVSAQTGTAITASGPAAALSALLLNAAAAQNWQPGIPTAAQGFVPADPGHGPWHLSGDAEAIALHAATGTSLLSGLETAQPLLDLVQPSWVDIGWCPGPDLAQILVEAFASVPEAEPTPDALGQGMAQAAAGFAQRALDAAQSSGMSHPALGRLAELAGAAQSQETPQAITTHLAETFPAHRDEIKLFARCGAGWAHILSGQSGSALQYLLDPEDPELLLRVYRDGPASRQPNGLVAAAVQALVAARGPQRPIKVLEIGAGTGATTARLLPLLPQGSTYIATDLASGLLAALGQRHADHPALQTRLLDATKPFEAQGVARGSVDVIVAANILHAIEAPAQALHEIRTALAPGGQFVLQELTHRAPWLDLVFGLTDGWWSAARSDGPLMGQASWLGLLRDCGLDPVGVAHPQPLETQGAQAVIVTQPTRSVEVLPHAAVAVSDRAPQAQSDDTILAIPDHAAHLALARTRAVELRGQSNAVLLIDPVAEHRPTHLAAGQEPQMRLMGDRLEGFRLTPVQVRSVVPNCAAVLVLGGTGGIGRIVTRHLAAQGVARIVVTGRSATPDHPAVSTARAAALSDTQRIEAEQIDLLNSTQAKSRIAELLADGITHVIHAAGSDGSEQLSDDAAIVHSPTPTAKVEGTRILLEALDQHPQVSLVLLSSAAATLGLAGAAGYAIANARAEDLIMTARAAGQRASYVALGPVRNAGMAQTAGAEHWHRFGVRLLAPDRVARTVATALHDATGFAPCLLVDMDWSVARQFIAYGKDGRHLAALLSPQDSGAQSVRGGAALSGTAALIAAPTQPQALDPGNPPRPHPLTTLPGAAQQVAAQTVVAESVAAVLGMADSSGIGYDMGLNDLGLDSLTAVDLAARLSRETGLTLSPTLAFDYPTVSLMAAYLLTQLGPEVRTTDAATVEAPKSPAAQDRATLPGSAADQTNFSDESLLHISDADAWHHLVTEGA